MINIQVLKVMFNKMDSCIKMNRGGINLFYRIRYGMGIVWNYLRYKATISDYFELRFFEKNSKEKKEYLTSKDGLRFAQYVDSQEVFTQLCSKKEMYRELKKYVKRDQLYSAESTKEDFEKFVDKHNSFLYKLDVADCGRGIEKWTVSKGSIEDLYNKFKKSPAVLDELVTQHQELSKLNPSSVNTIRIFTVMIGNECEIIGAALRMGVGDTVIDNYSAGGTFGVLCFLLSGLCGTRIQIQLFTSVLMGLWSCAVAVLLDWLVLYVAAGYSLTLYALVTKYLPIYFYTLLTIPVCYGYR